MASPHPEDGVRASASRHEPQNTSPRRPSHYYSGRVRTGCLICRARKVKCDEGRPSCQKCIRLNKTCAYRIPQRWTADSHHPATIDCQHGPLSSNSSRDSGQSTAVNGDYTPHGQLFLPETGNSASGVTGALEIDNGIEAPNQPLQAVADSTSSTHDETAPNQRSLGQADGLSMSEGASDRFQQTSQLIYLSTSLDWLAASQVPTTLSFSYFIQEVDSPFISPFDRLNWTRIKDYIIPLGVQHDTVAKSILAVQVLHRAQVDRLPMDHAMSVYQAAITGFESISSDESFDFRVVLVVAFLLCLAAATLPNVDGSAFSVLDGAFSTRLETWLLAEDHAFPVELRICAWIRCLNTSTKRPGSVGLLSPPLSRLLYEHVRTVPSISELDRDTHPENGLYDIISTPLFVFYLEVQRISNRVADVTHYRRSRTTPEDQAEVTDILDVVESDMRRLWEVRPAQLRLQPEELRQHFSAQIARPLIALAGLCIAAFHTETVTIGRIRGDPPYPSVSSKQALAQIRGIIEGDWNVSDGGTLNSGYLRPIFMYALESFQKEETQWAADRLRQIKDPISRSNFLASFVEVHGEEQRSQGRRITMKYFCYQTFGVPLPFM